MDIDSNLSSSTSSVVIVYEVGARCSDPTLIRLSYSRFLKLNTFTLPSDAKVLTLTSSVSVYTIKDLALVHVYASLQT